MPQEIRDCLPLEYGDRRKALVNAKKALSKWVEPTKKERQTYKVRNLSNMPTEDICEAFGWPPPPGFGGKKWNQLSADRQEEYAKWQTAVKKNSDQKGFKRAMIGKLPGNSDSTDGGER